MSTQRDLGAASVRQLAERLRPEMTPLNARFSYYAAGLPFSGEDLREYLQEPVAALPPSVIDALPKVALLLVPRLEPVLKGKDRRNGKRSAAAEKQPETRDVGTVQWVSKEEAVLVFAVENQEVADYHYRFFHLIAELLADHRSADGTSRYAALLREELTANTHGEADEESWHLKQVLLRRQSTVRRDTKQFLAYARQSFIDTATLYLHGICCDIDVEPGPRQIASRCLRKRLQLLRELYPPPKGYAVFPEELSNP